MILRLAIGKSVKHLKEEQCSCGDVRAGARCGVCGCRVSRNLGHFTVVFSEVCSPGDGRGSNGLICLTWSDLDLKVTFVRCAQRRTGAGLSFLHNNGLRTEELPSQN